MEKSQLGSIISGSYKIRIGANKSTCISKTRVPISLTIIHIFYRTFFDLETVPLISIAMLGNLDN